MFSASFALRSRNALRSRKTSHTMSGAMTPITSGPRCAPIAQSFFLVGAHRGRGGPVVLRSGHAQMVPPPRVDAADPDGWPAVRGGTGDEGDELLDAAEQAG